MTSTPQTHRDAFVASLTPRQLLAWRTMHNKRANDFINLLVCSWIGILSLAGAVAGGYLGLAAPPGPFPDVVIVSVGAFAFGLLVMYGATGIYLPNINDSSPT